jgi:hypothetical protein
MPVSLGAIPQIYLVEIVLMSPTTYHQIKKTRQGVSKREMPTNTRGKLKPNYLDYSNMDFLGFGEDLISR